VLRAVINEHRNAINSETPYKTNNYHLICTPKQELKAVLKPEESDNFPGAAIHGRGGREMLPFRVLLSAAGCLEKKKDDHSEKILDILTEECGSLVLTDEDKVTHWMHDSTIAKACTASETPASYGKSRLRVMEGLKCPLRL
jgi:hypothetical protein